MAKFCNVVLVLALALVVQATARNVSNDAVGLNDQNNFFSYGGVGGYSGIGANDMPMGGVGSVGGFNPLDGTGGTGGLVGSGFGGPDAGIGGCVGGAGAGIGNASGVIHFP